MVLVLFGLPIALLPAYVRSRNMTAMEACLHNLSQIDGAVQGQSFKQSADHTSFMVTNGIVLTGMVMEKWMTNANETYSLNKPEAFPR